MAQTAFSIRMDEVLKRDFGQFCENIGMTMSTAFVAFAKAALRNRRIPFAIADYRDDGIREREESRQAALLAFDSLRAEAQKRIKGESEPTPEEIDAAISLMRERRQGGKSHNLPCSVSR